MAQRTVEEDTNKRELSELNTMFAELIARLHPAGGQIVFDDSKLQMECQVLGEKLANMSKRFTEAQDALNQLSAEV